MTLTRRGWLGTTLAAIAALLVPARAHANPPAPPPKRKRWIGHY
jgi:hypothetical protein